jgi:hypothetical protein
MPFRLTGGDELLGRSALLELAAKELCVHDDG